MRALALMTVCVIAAGAGPCQSRMHIVTVLGNEDSARMLQVALGAADHLAEGLAVTRSYGSPELLLVRVEGLPVPERHLSG